jgi:L-rhamnose-H+ transport protein
MGIALLGVLFHWLGGLASGSFYVPYKRVRNWSWETYWLVGGFASWLFAPWIFALILTSGPIEVLKEIESSVILKTYLCGVCWGMGGLTFGLTMRYLGMSLGMAIALGYCAAVGTLVPPIADGTFLPKVWNPVHGKVVLLGILVCLCGIAIAGWAGTEKEKGMSTEDKKKSIKEFNFPKGLLIATFSGIMSAFFSFGFKAGEPINAEALAQGTSSHWGGLTTLIVILAGGFTTNFIWCVILNAKNRTGYEYFAKYQLIPVHEKDATALETATDAPAEEMAGSARLASPINGRKIPVLNNYIFSALAGTVWYLQFFFYQIGESKMGEFKFSSWTLHMASIIVFSSLWGLALGEWKGSGDKARKLLFIGLATLVASTMIVGIGNWMGASGGSH